MRLLLGEDQLVVDGDLEDPAAAPYQLGRDAEPAFNLRRQTGGARVVVSHRAVFDAHLLHVVLLSWTILVQAVRPLYPESSLQILDQRCTCSVEERNETAQGRVWAYRCLTGPKRDTQDKFSWIFPSS
jgi:hypothetical protein